MIGAPNPVDSQLTAVTVPPDDPIFDFTITDWIDPPKFITTLPETTKESNIRSMTEKEYRDSTTPSAWLRYVTLGRYVTDGFTFDSIMSDILHDPRKVHCLIWFQYSYHLDHTIQIPEKLQSWYSRRSKPFLVTNHLYSAFNLNTKKTTWTEFSRNQSLSNPWSEVQSAKQKKKKKDLPRGFASASIFGNNSKPSTISEEPSSKASASTTSRGTKRTATNDAKSTSSDGKQSVLEQSLNVPVGDGTYRVTIRWKTKIDLYRSSGQTQLIKDEIYNLLNDIFDDKDGFLYPWQQDGTAPPVPISQMSPAQVRQYISPSISILPSQSLLVIPLRFGFSSSTPSTWRNQPSTRSKLDDHDATVSFSNCTSTSGDLTIAGYILLKAPMTTHRLRYLQSLRQLLPTTTPPFDILLHKRTPFDQQIPHLVIQCGNKTVHTLSEALANILTGDCSSLYIPRFALSQMTESESKDLFTTHDVHVKSLRWLKLNPLLSNLDKPRKEYNLDGTIQERTTREWARTIKNIDGTASAQCDVVNGGSDQLSYLLFLPQHTEAATMALETYRRRLFPYTQREAKFRDSIGPPSSITMSRSVIANLDFIKRLSTSSQQSETATNDSDPKDTTSTVTPASDMTDTAPCPPTSAESLRQLYRQRSLTSDSSDIPFSATSDEDDELTSASTVSNTSKLSAGRMSTSSAKIRELDAVIQRQHKITAKKEAQSSERLSSIERQLHRIHDLDAKLDEVQTDFGNRLNLFEARMLASVTSNMSDNMQQLIAVVNQLSSSAQPIRDDPTLATTDTPNITDPTSILRNELLYTAQGSSSSSDSTLASNSSNLDGTSSSSNSSMSAESTSKIQSPEHKRPRSKKKSLKPSIRRYLDSALEAASSSQPPSPIPTQHTVDSLDHAMQQIDDIMKTDFSSTDVQTSILTDPESQYTAEPAANVDSKQPATLSPGRSSVN
jgi:hypothetical protein